MSEQFHVNLDRHDVRMIVDYIQALQTGRQLPQGYLRLIDQRLSMLQTIMESPNGKSTRPPLRTNRSA